MRNRWLSVLATLLLTLPLAGCQEAARAPAGDGEAQDTAAGTAAAVADECRQYAGRPIRDSVAVSIQGDAVTVSPETTTVARGGQVTWDSDHPTIVFIQVDPQRGRPTDAGLFAKGKGKGKVRAPIRANARCGVYKYDLGVYDASTGQMLPLDPPLMVVPRG